MHHVSEHTELIVRMPEKPGVVLDVLARMATAGVNILAHSSTHCRGTVAILLITDNVHAAQTAARAAGWFCQTDSVLLVRGPNRLGAAAEIGQRLHAAGVSILRSYAAAHDGLYCAVFKTDDNPRALHLLRPPTVAPA